jgi:hypothetical protein
MKCLSRTDFSLLQGSVISGNQAALGPGGGIYAASYGGSKLYIADSTISNVNFSQMNGGGVFAHLKESSSLDVERSNISGNYCKADGGGIFAKSEYDSSHIFPSQKAITISGSTVSGNTAWDRGGGIYAFDFEGTETVVSNCRVTGNHATSQFSSHGNGGGIYAYIWDNSGGVNRPKFTISGSTVDNNDTLKKGGGIFVCSKHNGYFIASNSTISANRTNDPLADDAPFPGYIGGGGGGLFIAHFDADIDTIDADLRNITVTQNRSVRGGGIGTFEKRDDVRVRIANSIISQNFNHDGSSANNLVGRLDVANIKYNLIGSGSIFFDQLTGNPVMLDPANMNLTNNDSPGLGPLTNNGGPTLTYLPQVGSPAIDAGDPSAVAGANGVPTYDQRGNPFGRIFDQPLIGSPSAANKIDIGAVEVQRRPGQVGSGPTDPTINVYGDYNRDGTVNAADYGVWRDHFNQSFSFKDAMHPFVITGYWLPNEDPAQTDPPQGSKGVVDAADYSFWKQRFGLTGNSGSGSQAYAPGDFNLDGIVNDLDRDIWIATVGSSTDLRADANYDHIVDLTDLQICQEYFGVTTLDALSAFGDLNGDNMIDAADMTAATTTQEKALVTANFGTVRADLFPTIINGTDRPPVDILGAAPVVLDVTVGSTHFAGVVGSGEQLRSIAAVNPNAVSIRFSEEVLVTSTALQVINLDGTSPGSLSSFVYDLATQTATWTFGSSFADGRYLLRLSDSVFDLSHDKLDGEFTNPWTMTAAAGTSSVFPSGDGTAGGEFRFRFTLLAADSDHDNVSGSTNYVNWKSSEPGMIYVSTTTDEYDADLSFGDVSLREAVNYANTASEPTTIVLPTGRYTLSLTGSESTANVAVNDLDIAANVTIVGDGAGVSIIDNSGLASQTSGQGRTFEVGGAAARLKLLRLTVANGSSMSMDQVAYVNSGATLEIDDSAIVNHRAYAGAAAVLVSSANIVVARSVFTNDDNTSIYGGCAIMVSGSTNTITVGDSIFALNTQPTYSGGTARVSIWISGTATKVNNGHNLYDYAGGGFFDTTPGTGDHLGTPQYVVTSVADEFNHANDLEALSLREAVDLANTTSGTQEIWVPAWKITLTRDRGTNATDTDVTYGDLDVKDSLVVRGVAGKTQIGWKAGVTDAVFDLLGDFNHDGEADAGNVSSADYTIWQDQNGSVGAYEQFSADANDDGRVDSADYAIWSQNYGHTLQLSDVN